MKKAYNRCLITKLPSKLAPVHPAIRWIVGNSPGSSVNYIYSPASDTCKLTEVQLYISASCQPGSWVIRAFSDVEKPFLFSDLAVRAAISENKEGL